MPDAPLEGQRGPLKLTACPSLGSVQLQGGGQAMGEEDAGSDLRLRFSLPCSAAATSLYSETHWALEHAEMTVAAKQGEGGLLLAHSNASAVSAHSKANGPGDGS